MTAPLDGLPRISIVVPSLNQDAYLRDCLDSIFRQRYPRLDVIVMDGGSSDRSVEIIREYASRLRYWQSRPDEGQASAINAGVAHGRGDLIAWLNSDDSYWGDALWTVARAYAEHPGHGLYVGNGLRYQESSRRYTPFCRGHVVLNRTALVHGLDYVLQPATFFSRRAWQEAGGLNAQLSFCMDWDLVLRISARHPAVLISEFLAVSREHGTTKTASGRLRRTIEIATMIQTHARQEITPGTAFYLLETVRDVIDATAPAQLHEHLSTGLSAIAGQLHDRFGRRDGFPVRGDPQDAVYLPFVRAADADPGVRFEPDALPSITVITPSFNQSRFLGQALDSVLSQRYPHLETIVIDGGSADGSVEVLRGYADRLTHWVSEPDRGPAHAINKGLARATGDVLGWLNSDDLLARDALWEVGRAFARDPELDMVFGNALYVDEHDVLCPVDHGGYRTALYFGEVQPPARIPAYWSYVHAIPQPTVFFRRRLLDACGPLDERYQFVFDFELFARFTRRAKIAKLERVQAFYRIHTAAKTSDWSQFLIELYRFSRPRWPKWHDPEFRRVFRDFLRTYMRRRYGHHPRGARFWAVSALVGLSILTRVGNPEAFRSRLLSAAAPPAPATPAVDGPPGSLPTRRETPVGSVRTAPRYRTVFCGLAWPRYPGFSGGEIRDFHLVERLLSVSRVTGFVSYDPTRDARQDLLAPRVDVVHTPGALWIGRPELLRIKALRPSLVARLARPLGLARLPRPFGRYHREVADHLRYILAYTRLALQEALDHEPPDFLFVSPQMNAAALELDTHHLPTRLILATYDVEAVRLRRLAETRRGFARLAALREARRAATFERENLTRFDGVLAVSELDKELFVRLYGFPPERILVVDNGVDPDYFVFTERRPPTPPSIVYVGSLGYPPNRDAAWRLLQRIMPLVRARHPDARVSIVGGNPGSDLLAQHDGTRTVVTGTVADVRPYLAEASLACVPLASGSGTKYKVLEALSAGVPVVCSPIAVEGLRLEDGRHLLVRATDEELATGIVQLLENRPLSAALARQGRDHIERHYAWSVTLSGLEPWLDTMAALPRRNAPGAVRTLQPSPVRHSSGALPERPGSTSPERAHQEDRPHEL
jgi:glycosyltransferase involved in cell wall biosynthesis